MTKCERENCFAHAPNRWNKCACLSSTYEDDNNCPFFRHKDDVDIIKMNKDIAEYKRTH